MKFRGDYALFRDVVKAKTDVRKEGVWDGICLERGFAGSGGGSRPAVCKRNILICKGLYFFLFLK